MPNYIKLLFYCNVVYTKIRRSIESIYRIDIRSFKIEFYTLHIRYINIPICPCSYGGHCWFIISVVGQQFRYSGDQISIYVITFDVDLEMQSLPKSSLFGWLFGRSPFGSGFPLQVLAMLWLFPCNP